MKEVELGVWVPVSRTLFDQLTPGFYLPFVFNDSPASVVTGREVYGYPKQLADFTTEGNPDYGRDNDNRPLKGVTLKTWHIPRAAEDVARPDNERAGMEYRREELLRIDSTGALLPLGIPTSVSSSLPIRRSGSRASSATWATSQRSRGPRLRFVPKPTSGQSSASFEEFSLDMVRAAPLYFLRQFRDPVDPFAATVQQIVQARFVIQSNPTTTEIGGGTSPSSRPYSLPLAKSSVLGTANRTTFRSHKRS